MSSSRPFFDSVEDLDGDVLSLCFLLSEMRRTIPASEGCLAAQHMQSG